MQMNRLKVGTRISPEIRIDAPLDVPSGIEESERCLIETYLATDSEIGHVLVHLIPDNGASSVEQLDKAEKFYRDELNMMTRYGRIDEGLFFAEPFPLGEYMFEWLERRERVSLPEAIKRVIAQLRILQVAHANGLFHGRLTPKTILLERTGERFELRIMGLGVSQAMPKDKQLDIDWLNYTFDLEGMSPRAVDIYGMAIILMGLVSGESGIDSFEDTGLLPQVLRGGLLQQAMERALELRFDSYTDVLSFSQDLEAALLELDGKQGELFVSDLVGFESAVRSIVSITEETYSQKEASGTWDAIVDTIEDDERSNLLRSLTSLTSIRPVDDDDEDVTRISAVPDFVLNSRRIHSVETPKVKSSLEVTQVIDDSSKTSVSDIVDSVADEQAGSGRSVRRTEDLPPVEGLDEEKSKRLAELQNMEAELAGDEPEDDAPTRVMQRPNYISVSIGQEDIVAESKAEPSEEDKLKFVLNRVNETEIVVADNVIIHDVRYDPHDIKAFPEGYVDEEAPTNENDKIPREPEKVSKPKPRQKNSDNSVTKSKKPLYLLIAVLATIIVVLIIVVIVQART